MGVLSQLQSKVKGAVPGSGSASRLPEGAASSCPSNALDGGDIVVDEDGEIYFDAEEVRLLTSDIAGPRVAAADGRVRAGERVGRQAGAPVSRPPGARRRRPLLANHYLGC